MSKLLWSLAGASLVLLAYELYTLSVGVLWPLLDNPNALQTDFHYYYEAAGRFALDRGRLYLATDDSIAGFAYPPLAILPFMALSRLPLGVALLGLTLASYSALLIAVWWWCADLRRRGVSVDSRTKWIVTLIAVASGPTYMNATFGQVNAFVLLACVAFLVLFERAAVAAGIFLALGMWLKVYPALMILVGAWDRRAWKAVAWAGVAAVTLLIAALPIVPLSTHGAFVSELLPSRIDKTAVHVLNQSLVAFLERFQFDPPRYLQWTGEQAVTVGPLIRAMNVLVTLLAVFFLGRRASGAVLMALVAMVAPLGWGHTYMLVLPLVIVHLTSMGKSGPAHAVVVFACVAALMVPAGRLFSFADSWPGWMQNLLYSRYFLATAVLALMTSSGDRARKDWDPALTATWLQKNKY